jgi:hypothetical protein
MSYRTSTLEPQAVAADEDILRVTYVEGSDTTRLQVRDPWVHTDTLGGTPCTADRTRGTRCDAADTLAVPLTSVIEIETMQTSASKTALFVVGTTLTIALVAGMAAMATWDGPFGN